MSKTAQLRLSISGDKIVGEFKASDIDDWETVGECEPVNKRVVLVGLVTHGNVEEAERWVQFRDFSVSSI